MKEKPLEDRDEKIRTHREIDDDVDECIDFSEYGYMGHVQGHVTLCDGETRDDPGQLLFNWQADTYNVHGWWLGIFIHNQKEPVCNQWMGQESQSEGVLLSGNHLRFDPRTTPFRYIIYPG